MGFRLQAEQLESRETPAAGSRLVTIATGTDFTLSVNNFGRVASYQMAAPDWLAWSNGTQTTAQAQALSARLLSYFPDQFDQIMVIDNQDVAPPNTAYNGVNYAVQNTISGTGRALFNNTAQWGSAGHLQSFIHMTDRFRIRESTSLHELVHLSANFLPELQSNTPGHWGFSSVGGHLGGWKPGTLQYLSGIKPMLFDANGPTGSDDWYANSSYTNAVGYAPLELYLLGLIEANQVPDIQYGTNASFVPGPTNPFGIFQADSIQTVTYQNIVNGEGLRTPTPQNSQRNFRVLTVVLTPNPLTQAELDKYDTDVELFGRPGSDGDPTLNNFYEATGGRATLTMDGLDAFLPARTPILGAGTDGGALVAYTTNGGVQYNASTAFRSELVAFLGANPTDVRTSVGDVDGDNVQDFAIATGAGGITRFAVISGDQSRFIIPPTLPFRGSEDFTGGAFVTAGDIDNDGRDDVIVTPDQGGGPRVVIFSFKQSVGTYVLADFIGIGDVNFRGGARTAMGDINNDGKEDLAVAAGFGGGPRVAIYDGSTFFLPGRTRLVSDFFAFPGSDATSLRNGVWIAMGDINADGFSDLVFGGGPGGAARVYSLNGRTLVTNGITAAYSAPLSNFFVGNDSAGRSGVRVTVKNVDGDKREDIVTGSGEFSLGRIRVYRGSSVTANREPQLIQELDPFFNTVLQNGVYVG